MEYTQFSMFLAKIDKMVRQVLLNVMDMYITVYGIHIYFRDARVTYYGPLDGDFFYNRTENGNTFMHKMWWTPNVADLGTNVVCLSAHSINKYDLICMHISYRIRCMLHACCVHLVSLVLFRYVVLWFLHPYCMHSLDS